MDTPMTVWVVACQGERRLEMEGDAGLLGTLLRTIGLDTDAHAEERPRRGDRDAREVGQDE